MKRSIFICISFLMLASCKEPEARRPKQHSTTNFYKELIEENKRINAIENKRIAQIITKDSTRSYTASSSGFWYTYIIKDSVNTTVPKANDVVTIKYNITSIDNVVLYPNEQIDYKVDKEDLIPALQDGIKLMKQGETITFVIPSYRAFGVTGDGKKIGINQPIKSTVTLVKINKNQ